MIIGLLGRMGSGKGTVADELVDTYGFRQDSYAATLKDITSLLFNWERDMLTGDTIESRSEREQIDHWWSEQLGIPNFTPRLALQLIGTDVFRNNFHKDIWMLSVMNRYKDDENVVISDCRFQTKFKQFVNLVDALFALIVVKNRFGGRLQRKQQQAMKMQSQIWQVQESIYIQVNGHGQMKCPMK